MEEELRTLFISGLPRDATEREMYLLCRTCPGYEGCSLALTASSSPLAFVIFSNNAAAMAAMDALQGTQFDPDSSNQLRIELAKKNSAPKRQRAEGEAGGAARRRFTPTTTPPFMTPGSLPPQYDPFGAPPPYDPFAQSPYGYPGTAPYGIGLPPPGKPTHRPQNPAGGGCTLFIAGLSAEANEPVVRAIFSQTTGLKNVKFKPGEFGKSAAAWVQYDNPESAASAKAIYHGSSPMGAAGPEGLRVEYAKTEMSNGGA